MPATVETDPPGIWCMFSDGSTIRFSLDGLPCPGLARGPADQGLAGLVHPARPHRRRGNGRASTSGRSAR